MELHAGKVVAHDRGGDRAAIVGDGNQILAMLCFEMVGMHEIGVQPL
jgi:hypothetical protein